MASYTHLSFSQEAFKNQMMNLCDLALDDAIRYILSSEWFSGSSPIEVNDGSSRYFEIPTNSLKAWIIEYGQGLSADTERNPYWDEYVQSGLTSPMRSSGKILKRGNGEYQTIDFSTGEVITRTGGEPSGTPVSAGIQKMRNITPQPFIDNMLANAFEVFKNSFNSRLSSFNILSCYNINIERV